MYILFQDLIGTSLEDKQNLSKWVGNEDNRFNCKECLYNTNNNLNNRGGCGLSYNDCWVKLYQDRDIW